ncbi:unnamed protein product [Adineta ricciae]|uniref:DYW domain-containing protein n=1 Tax=Adineta ricciae TaxID=249248 RepID=A0A814Y756_ADIRI|nr:unnamed protein product [Adineta ricciae]CAF1225014.1 unnamed protein product [Adineta ricciae]
MICLRLLTSTNDTFQNDQQITSNLCREYGRRMKTHLNRAENDRVLSLFDELIQKHQIKPTYMNYLLAMQAITGSKQRIEADRLHDLIEQDDSIRNGTQVQRGLVYMYAVALGDVSHAEKLVAAMPKPTHISIFATLMTGYIRHGTPEKAVELFTKIENEGQLTHDRFSYNAMINACSKLGDYARGKEIVDRILVNNDPHLLQNTNLITTMIDMLGKAGSHLQQCIQLFNSIQLEKRTPSLYNAMMKAYNKSAVPKETLALFEQRIDEQSYKPDRIHFLLVFNACAKIGRVCLKDAHKYYQRMLNDLRPCARNSHCRNAAIDMFGKCADLQMARSIFETNQDLNDIVSWGTILNTYALHANGRQVLHMFERMQMETEIKPNAQIYSTVLSACSHSGLLDEAKKIFLQYKIELPELWKYITIIDALARADRFDEALKMIEKYELTNPPSITMYMSILSRARRCGLVSVAETIVRRLENLNTFRSEDLKVAYVLLGTLVSNLYNAQGRREDAFKIRQLMRDKQMKKMPGLTWIEINGTLHEFYSNDRRHSQTDEIYKEVACIDDELEKDGHMVDNNSVPSGSVHSEKLAIALALISTSSRSSLVLTKNLRICPDCHEMLKRLSKLRNRKIVFRDSFRYHEFDDGQCSCGDIL